MHRLRRRAGARSPRPPDPRLARTRSTKRTGILYSASRSNAMPVDTTYTSLRENLAAVLDRVTDDQEVVIVRRRGARDVALIPADELSSLMETAYLLRSPAQREAPAGVAAPRQARQRQAGIGRKTAAGDGVLKGTPEPQDGVRYRIPPRPGIIGSKLTAKLP